MQNVNSNGTLLIKHEKIETRPWYKVVPKIDVEQIKGKIK